MSESIRGQMPSTVERREWISRCTAELLVELAVVWILIFGLVLAVLSFAVSPLHGWLSISADATRAATLVDAAILILYKLLPARPNSTEEGLRMRRRRS
jgi:hypothetical protein